MLIGSSTRISNLLAAGVPSGLIDSMAKGPMPPALVGVIEEPEATYWYYERHPSLWGRYGADSVVPIGALPSGGEFFDLITKDGKTQFVKNVLEGDWSLIGSSIEDFSRFLATGAYELHDSLEIEKISDDLLRLGLSDTSSFLTHKERQDV